MLKTEKKNPNTINIDKASTLEMLKLIQEENYNAVRAIDPVMAYIEKACDLITERMAKGGRLIYIGAGTSGRLGVMDAVECPSTYGVSEELVSGIIAGGYDRSVGCLTVGLTCNKESRLGEEPDISIVTDTGAEVITGSTRMKAGSAHKMVLNMISTTVMVKSGHVYENMMINLKPTNIKLKNRMISIVCEKLKCDEAGATQLLDEHNWSIRKVVDCVK